MLLSQHFAQHHQSGYSEIISKQEGAISNQSYVRIFIVDDFAAWRQYVIEKLRENLNFEVIGVASDGLEAVRKAEELQPDLILLDIGLPRLDGIGAARQIHIVAPESKILFVSQELDLDVAREALSVGGQGFVVKSEAESELLAAIEAVMLGQRFESRRLRSHPFADVVDSQADGQFRRAGLIASHPAPAPIVRDAGLLWAEGKADAAIRLEELWDEIARTRDIDILCG